MSPKQHGMFARAAPTKSRGRLLDTWQAAAVPSRRTVSLSRERTTQCRDTTAFGVARPRRCTRRRRRRRGRVRGLVAPSAPRRRARTAACGTSGGRGSAGRDSGRDRRGAPASPVCTVIPRCSLSPALAYRAPARLVRGSLHYDRCELEDSSAIIMLLVGL